MPITVDANCRYGNVCDVNVTRSGSAYEVAFAADPHGGPECLWFRFRILWDGTDDGDTPPAIRLVLKYPQNMLGIHSAALMCPVVRAAGGDWERLAPGIEQPLPDGRWNGIWDVQASAPYLDVAWCYPYGQPELDALVAETGGYWHVDAIGVSQQARPILRLANDYGQPDGTRPGIYIVARQHAAEVTGTWVLDGFLRHMAAAGNDAPLIWAVPFSNIDGIENGDYGKDNFPYDLNRAWGVCPMRHETQVIGRDVARWTRRCKPALGIDYHSPSGCEAEGMYAFMVDEQIYPEIHRQAQQWAGGIQSSLTERYAMPNFARVAHYASRWETPTFCIFCAESFKMPALSIETPYSMIGDTVVTREDYREAGKRIAEAIVDILAAD